ncbi:thioredoxin, mitochondrial-like isoform X2 [Schistocerca nitens]|uniref:thioredoxin, mitochondrial-like isoform X1 n=1 Tax=Schistocerca nitens TaxID=7011 RepID=UPI0021194AA2|nr:thioredoxin, mitochondrial-like isoform X1 [Schistocerca nitens]XP_049810048.1 thioredoxin, mitochondrial-like isoform X2 [Schistocerca nitens]
MASWGFPVHAERGRGWRSGRQSAAGTGSVHSCAPVEEGWCKPCEKLTPRIESVIAEKKGKILLAKVDVDENTDLAMDYEVGSIPSLIAIENGKVKERLDGLQNTEKLRSFVDKICKTEKADE